MKTEQEIRDRIAELEEWLEDVISYSVEDDLKCKIEALKWVLGEK